MTGIVKAARVVRPIAAAFVVALVFVQVYRIAEFIFGDAGALDTHIHIGRVVDEWLETMLVIREFEESLDDRSPAAARTRGRPEEQVPVRLRRAARVPSLRSPRPRTASSASSSAKDALQPEAARDAVARVRPRDRFRRRNAAYVRQGEWFFCPGGRCVDEADMPSGRTASRGRGEDDLLEFAYRAEARRSLSTREHRAGISASRVRVALAPRSSGVAANRQMVRDPELYAKGFVRPQPDHNTIVLHVLASHADEHRAACACDSGWVGAPTYIPIRAGAAGLERLGLKDLDPSSQPTQRGRRQRLLTTARTTKCPSAPAFPTVCPSGWVRQAVRAPGVKWTLLAPSRDCPSAGRDPFGAETIVEGRRTRRQCCPLASAPPPSINTKPLGS